jgi:cytidylate kinase
MHPPHQKYLHGLRTAVEEAAERGHVVIVGRGACHLLGERPDALHVRLVAPKPWRAERMSRLNGWSAEQALARCTEMDRVRDRFARYFFGDKAGQASEYDLIVNTGRVPLDDAEAVAAAIVRGTKADAPRDSAAGRVLTLSRELGAGESGFATALAERLKMHAYDRELLEQEAVRLGVSETELEKIDEHAAGIFQRFRPGSVYQRYAEALGQIMQQLAESGEAIVVGRGGNCFLRSHPRAFHVRVIAPLPVRVRRVMEYRWVAERVAKEFIARSDAQRRSFCESYFGVDWADPLEYHMTINSGRLGTTALDLASLAAERHWSRDN